MDVFAVCFLLLFRPGPNQSSFKLGDSPLNWNIEVYNKTLKSGCQIELRQLGPADPGRQSPPLHTLHANQGGTVPFSDFEDHRRVGMLQDRGSFGIPDKASQPLWIGGQLHACNDKPTGAVPYRPSA